MTDLGGKPGTSVTGISPQQQQQQQGVMAAGEARQRSGDGGAGITRSGTGPDEPEIEELIPPDNFALVCRGVYRSAFPKKKNFPFLKKLKFKSIMYRMPPPLKPPNEWKPPIFDWSFHIVWLEP